jgi:Arc/MetJ-type ribon-helix-helix transcriptional regulator
MAIVKKLGTKKGETAIEPAGATVIETVDGATVVQGRYGSLADALRDLITALKDFESNKLKMAQIIDAIDKQQLYREENYASFAAYLRLAGSRAPASSATWPGIGCTSWSWATTPTRPSQRRLTSTFSTAWRMLTARVAACARSHAKRTSSAVSSSTTWPAWWCCSSTVGTTPSWSSTWVRTGWRNCTRARSCLLVLPLA